MYMNNQLMDFDDYSIMYFTDGPLFPIKNIIDHSIFHQVYKYHSYLGKWPEPIGLNLKLQNIYNYMIKLFTNFTGRSQYEKKLNQLHIPIFR